MKRLEEWRPVAGYEGLYEVSSTGKVASLNYNGTGKRQELKPITKHHGYQLVRLYKNGDWKGFRVHRLVAAAFIPNKDSLPEINHIDEDPTNNAVENLEWCDHLYNSRYGTKSIRQSKKMINGKLSKAVIATLPDGTEEEYPSMAEAHRQLGCSQGRISDACLGKIDSYHHGRKWRFKGAAT